jgi:RNA polymerase sigma-70 factor (ECF subfamily)
MSMAMTFESQGTSPEPPHRCSAPVASKPRGRAAAARPDESALVQKLRAGDEHAFELVVRTYGGTLLATARRLLRNEEDARDAVQEAFLAASRSIQSFEGTARISTWLHRIVVNAALMRLRSRRRRPELAIEELLPRFDDTGHRVELEEQAPACDEEMSREELRRTVRACIDRLPEVHRTVLLLRDIEELDTRATAAALGLSLEAVKTRLHRARQALQALLQRELGHF